MARLYKLLLLGAAAALTNAADCGPQDLSTLMNGEMFPDAVLYGARQSMCEGRISCDSQQTTNCVKYFRISADYDVTLTGTSSSKSYSHCFDGLQDIITQCYDQGHSTGTWTLDDQTFTIKVASNTLEDQFVPDVPNAAQVPLPQISLVNAPDLLVPFTTVPTSSSTTVAAAPPSTTSASCPSVPPCPAGKSCPDPVPCDQLSCSKDCCGTVPNPQWCNDNCGGVSC